VRLDRLLRCGLAIAATLLTSIAQAQLDTPPPESPPPESPAPAPEDDSLPMLPLTRLRAPVTDAATSTVVIEGRVLRHFGIWSLPQMLRLVSGADVQRIGGADIRLDSGIDGFQLPTVRRINLLVDGVLIYRAGYSQIYWPLNPVTPDDIVRVEVTRGPNSADAGAEPGVVTINVFTRHPSDTERAYLAGTRGSEGADSVTARAGFTVGATALRLTANRYSADQNDEAPANRSPLQGLVSKRATLRTETAIGTQSTWDVDLAFLEASRENAESDRADVLTRGRIGYANSVLRHSISPTHELSFTANYWWTTPRLVPTSLSRSRTVVEARDAYVASDRLRVESGIGARGNRWVSRDRQGPWDDGWTGYGFVGLVVRPWDWVTINSGLRIDDAEGRGAVLSPRAAASFHIAPGQAVRLGWSSGVWAPEAQDPRPLIPRSISRERVESTEVGYVLNLPEWGLQLDARGYRNRLTDQVVLLKTPSTLPAQVVEVSGSYSGADLRMTADWSADWSGYLALSTLRRSGSDVVEEGSRRYLDAYSGGLSWHGDSGWTLAASVFGTSGEAGNVSRTRRIDLMVGKSLVIAGARARIALVWSMVDDTINQVTPDGSSGASSSYQNDRLLSKFEVAF
jgi:outer membrane cobalamin receptor